MNSILEGIVDKKIIGILNVFIKNKNELFHLQKVSELSKVPLATSFRLMRRLVSLQLVKIIRINKFKVYKLAENKKTELLIRLLEK